MTTPTQTIGTQTIGTQTHAKPKPTRPLTSIALRTEAILRAMPSAAKVLALGAAIVLVLASARHSSAQSSLLPPADNAQPQQPETENTVTSRELQLEPTLTLEQQKQILEDWRVWHDAVLTGFQNRAHRDQALSEIYQAYARAGAQDLAYARILAIEIPLWRAHALVSLAALQLRNGQVGLATENALAAADMLQEVDALTEEWLAVWGRARDVLSSAGENFELLNRASTLDEGNPLATAQRLASIAELGTPTLRALARRRLEEVREDVETFLLTTNPSVHELMQYARILARTGGEQRLGALFDDARAKAAQIKHHPTRIQAQENIIRTAFDSGQGELGLPVLRQLSSSFDRARLFALSARLLGEQERNEAAAALYRAALDEIINPNANFGTNERSRHQATLLVVAELAQAARLADAFRLAAASRNEVERDRAFLVMALVLAEHQNKDAELLADYIQFADLRGALFVTLARQAAQERNQAEVDRLLSRLLESSVFRPGARHWPLTLLEQAAVLQIEAGLPARDRYFLDGFRQLAAPDPVSLIGEPTGPPVSPWRHLNSEATLSLAIARVDSESALNADRRLDDWLAELWQYDDNTDPLRARIAEYLIFRGNLDRAFTVAAELPALDCRRDEIFAEIALRSVQRINIDLNNDQFAISFALRVLQSIRNEPIRAEATVNAVRLLAGILATSETTPLPPYQSTNCPTDQTNNPQSVSLNP